MRTNLARVLTAAIALAAASPVAARPAPEAPAPDAVPALAAALASKVAGTSLTAPDGTQVEAGAILDAHRAEACLRTIGRADGWPASWLVVQDKTRPYDLVLRVALEPDGSLADPAPVFLAARRDWGDRELAEAVREATGKKIPRERRRSLVVQSFTTTVKTRYVYDLPKAGKDGKGLLALLPEGSLIREATAVDLGDGKRHTLAVVLMNPTFVPADCASEAGRKTGHRDRGDIVLVLSGEHALEDSLDITDIVKKATGAALLPRFPCEPGDAEPGAIDRLVDSKFEGRESTRLLSVTGRRAESRLDGLPVRVGIKRKGSGFKLFAEPLAD